MTVKYDDIVKFNKMITARGTFQKRGSERLKNLLREPPQSTICDVCAVGMAVAKNQYFSDGNHRTGILTVYLKLIEDADLITRKPAYQIYAFLDDALYRQEKNDSSNYAAFHKFIGEGGFIQLKETDKKESYRSRYTNEKIAEVKAVGDLLKKITARPAIPVGKLPESEEGFKELKKELRDKNIIYHKLGGKRDQFLKYHGGSLLHWSDR